MQTMGTPNERLVEFMKKQILNENAIVQSVTNGIKNIKITQTGSAYARYD